MNRQTREWVQKADHRQWMGPINMAPPLFGLLGNDGAPADRVLSTETWVSRDLFLTVPATEPGESYCACFRATLPESISENQSSIPQLPAY